MLNFSQNSGLNQINELFDKAEDEEHKYNWNSAIELLKKAKQISLEIKNKNKLRIYKYIKVKR